ncbi:MAG TPA: hypothetical protein VFA90_04305 [Terriglobales bacterium]|nr:hypothetical protein [Terriglobales bacterium]
MSSWILTMHGLSGKPADGAGFGKEEATTFLSALNEMASSRRLGPDTPGGLFKRIHEIGTEVGGPLGEAYKSGDQEQFNALFPEFAVQMLEASGLPKALFAHMLMSPTDLLKLMRAARASFRCMAFLGEHPVILISRASKGDRRATLDLVKMDKMFLTDVCCRDTIRKAGLNDDTRFLAQLQRASNYKHKPGRRDILRLYMFVLMVCERLGVPIPPLPELYTKIDRYGREYKSLGAFERDFNRCRHELKDMMDQAEFVDQSALTTESIS